MCACLCRLTVLGALAARATPADAGQPITILMLHKAPMSMAAADAFLSACPHVKTLHIFTKGDTDIDRETYGMMQLVSRYGPQLQCLHLNWVDGWPTLALQCLASCTALVELGLSYNEFPNTHTLAGMCTGGASFLPSFGRGVWLGSPLSCKLRCTKTASQTPH